MRRLINNSFIIITFACTIVSAYENWAEDELEEAMITAETTKDLAKITDQSTAEDASHGSSYNSIISNYYKNDPLGYGSSSKTKSTKSQAIERLKRIFKRRDKVRDDETKMLEDQTRIDRGMIPAPLLARVKGRYVEDEETENSKNFDGIPAPLLVGGAYRSDDQGGDQDSNRVLKRRLDVVTESPRKRMHLKKIKKRKIYSDNRPDYLQERSVFSELISQRPKRQELPEIAPQVDEENVDTGLIDEEVEVTDEGRGFFEEPSFASDEPFFFPGDNRDDIPLLPEIENLENREPSLYAPKPSYGHKPYYGGGGGSRPSYRKVPTYGHMDSYFNVDYYRKYPSKRHIKSSSPNANNNHHHSTSFGHSYHKGMDYMNPMDYSHEAEDVDVFLGGKPSKYDHPPPVQHFRKSTGGFYEDNLEHQLKKHQDFFVDIPKINVESAILENTRNPHSSALTRAELLRDEMIHPDIEAHLDDFASHHEQHIPYERPNYHEPRHLTPDPPKKYRTLDHTKLTKRQLAHHPDISQHLDEFPDHQSPPYDPPTHLLEPEHRSLVEPSIKSFPSYHDIEPTHHEPRYIGGLPHLPPPPEMIEMQRNSLFPVDVPKIGVDAPYRPPELIFDELHRKQPFKRQIAEQRNNLPIMNSRVRPAPVPPTPIYNTDTLENMIRQVKTPEKSYQFSKFSDIVFKNNRVLAEEGASSHFPPPLPKDFIHDRVFNPYDQDEEVHEWENESRFKQYDKESEYWNYNDEFDHHQKDQKTYKPTNQELNSERYEKYANLYKNNASPPHTTTYRPPVTSFDKGNMYENVPTPQVTERSYEDHEYEFQPMMQPKHHGSSEHQKHLKNIELISQNDIEDLAVVTERAAYHHQENDNNNIINSVPSRPDPGVFHEQIESQFDFKNDPLNPMNYNHYENEAVEEVDPPIYVPKTTYKYERHDHQRELPMRAETLPDPAMMSYKSSESYADQPSNSNYYEYDPMDFVDHNNNNDRYSEEDNSIKKPDPLDSYESPLDHPEFPHLPPFGDRETEFGPSGFDDNELDRNDRMFHHPMNAVSDRRASSGRALVFAPEFGPTEGPPGRGTPALLEQNALNSAGRFSPEFGPTGASPPAGTPNVFDEFGLEFGPTGIDLHEENHQFTRVDAPDAYKTGHSRGNYIHNKQDIEEHNGPHHLQEMSWQDKHGGYGKHFYEYNHDYISSKYKNELEYF